MPARSALRHTPVSTFGASHTYRPLSPQLSGAWGCGQEAAPCALGCCPSPGHLPISLFPSPFLPLSQSLRKPGVMAADVAHCWQCLGQDRGWGASLTCPIPSASGLGSASGGGGAGVGFWGVEQAVNLSVSLAGELTIPQPPRSAGVFWLSSDHRLKHAPATPRPPSKGMQLKSKPAIW